MNTLAVWKFLLLQIPALFSFLCEFPTQKEGEQKKRFGLVRILLIAIGLGLWYFLSQSVTLSDQAQKDKAKIAELTQTINKLSMTVGQEKSAKERKEDRIDLLEARLREEESDLEKYMKENERLYEELATLKTRLSLCEGRKLTCKTYKPSVELFDTIDGLTEGDD